MVEQDLSEIIDFVGEVADDFVECEGESLDYRTQSLAVELDAAEEEQRNLQLICHPKELFKDYFQASLGEMRYTS